MTSISLAQTVPWDVFTAVAGWMITVIAVVFRAGQLTKDLQVITREVEQMRNELRSDLERLRTEMRAIAEQYNARVGQLEQRMAEYSALLRARGA